MPFFDRDVGVANADSSDPHHDFIGCRLLKVDLGECEWRAHLLHHRG
ncbi:Uncharacterised protein [Mycobacterium tuberculosis]|nr:Uncharacterised protein [Mycobacterium tuberculosis]